MKLSPFALMFGIAVSVHANGQAADPAKTAPPTGGAAVGAVAAPLPAEQRMESSPGRTKFVALAAGVAGFVAAASSGSASANH